MEGESLAAQLILQLVLIICNAVFACAEIAVISINDNKVAKMAASGDRRAVRLARLKSQPARFLATIQVAITLSGFLGSAFAADNFAKRLTDKMISMGAGIPEDVISTVSLVVTTLVLSYFTLVFGELVPKRVAMKKAEKLALMMSSMITGLSKLFAPVVWLLTKSTDGILRIMRINPEEEENEVSEEEIILMVDAGSEKGTIARDAQEMIENVFKFDDINAGEICTHRKDVEILWMEESDEEWNRLIIDSNHSLFPICGETADDIMGILSAKNYLRLEEKSRDNVIKYAVKPAYYVPEGIKADVLFKNMKKTRNRMAVVLDEYGGMRGIVTLNDLVEELVGNLNDDEEDVCEPYIEKTGDNAWRLNGFVPLDSLSEMTGLELPCEEYETFAGMVFGILGAIPEDGTTLEMKVPGLNVKIEEIRNHRIEKAYITKIK